MDGDDMPSHRLMRVKTHISDLYPPPRATDHAPQHGLTAGTAYDLTTGDDTNKPWDFDIPEQKAGCRQTIMQAKLSHALADAQHLTRPESEPDAHLGPSAQHLRWQHGLKHLRFTVEPGALQLREERQILHEHRLSASSWVAPQVVAFMHACCRNQAAALYISLHVVLSLPVCTVWTISCMHVFTPLNIWTGPV